MESSYENAISRFRTFLAEFVDPLGSMGGLLFLMGPDVHQRYRAVAKQIIGPKVLDVGSWGRSFFGLIWKDCVSLDARKRPGLDVIASATHLPFRSDSFDTVVCVDMIEHIPSERRRIALVEMKRVSARRAVVHAPVNDGNDFRARDYDLTFSNWHRKSLRTEHLSTAQHLDSVEPSPVEFERADFRLKGTHNAELWLSCMALSNRFRGPLGIIVSQSYYLLKRQKDGRPPFWGAVAVHDKRGPLRAIPKG